MKTNKVVSVEDYKIVSSFQTLRKTLLDDKFSDRLEKPLAYWAMPNDRRLPLAFLGRTIKDLLETPFDELSATPGIGQKKISCLMKLLSRATKDHPPAAPFGMADLAEGRPRGVSAEKARREQSVAFDPSVVSEAHWAEWRETVNRHGFGGEKLGRLAPTLQSLPTVIWHTPLEFYMNYTVAEIRQLKTHGEKRVRVVLEVFHLIHQTLASSACSDHLAVRMVPRFIESLEHWIHDAIARAQVPSPEDVRESFSIPLLNQLRVDAGDTVYELAHGRLGIDGPPQSVRHQSKEMGVTRARIYQLLEDCAKIMNVRWPEGQYLLSALSAKLNAVAMPSDDMKLFRSTLDLFFPGNHPIADPDADSHAEAAPEAVEEVEALVE